MPFDFRETAKRIRALAKLDPTPERRREIMEALTSKYEGIQAIAAHALGTWGDRESVTSLKTWLDRLLKRPRALGARKVAVRELVRCASDLGSDWVLDRYFGARDHLVQHELLPLAAALRPETIRPRILQAATDLDRKHRYAALKVIVRTRLVDRAVLVRRFLTDPDKMIRKIARAHAAA